jgi:hypothetical protein
MKRNVSVRLICISILFATVNLLRAQGTAFTYQGQLDEGGSPASGSYDFTFALYNTSNLSITNVAGPITNSAVVVTNGLFTTTLDFGSGIFTGTNYWLGIAVRTNGGTQFTGLSPRQPLLPVPYAIFATTASNLSGTLPSSQLSGALPSSQISGTYSSAVTFSNSANSFIGVFTGNFTGTGSSLSNLNASQLTTGTVADARLSSNVALLNTNQTFTGFNTFTGTNNLTGVNIFTNMGNNFHGSFFGNGLVGWIPTNATALQAVSDTGYLLTSPGLVTVTLPPTPNVSDIVRISGAGAGGWLVKENTGQFIYGNFASYRNSVLGTLPIYGSSSTGFSDVAASADGTQMYAVGTAIVGVYASADSGQTWNPVGGLSGSWSSVACSANGKIAYALSSAGGTIQMSSNFGATWTASTYSATAGSFIGCTADGSKVFTGNIACSGNGTYLAGLSGGSILLSTNSGANFNISVTGPTTGLSCVAASSDCTKLVAGKNGGQLYASANAGATWTPLTTASPNQAWSGAWMSPDGSKLAATTLNSGSVNGGIFYDSVSIQPNTVSTNSTIGSSQGSSVELQYIGSGSFMPVSSTGILWAN